MLIVRRENIFISVHYFLNPKSCVFLRGPTGNVVPHYKHLGRHERKKEEFL